MKQKPRCPECGKNNSVALPSQAFSISSGKVMVYRCRHCGDTFNDLTGIQNVPEVPKEPEKSPLEGLTEPERLEKIKQILSGNK